jgi:hypothetical protein
VEHTTMKFAYLRNFRKRASVVKEFSFVHFTCVIIINTGFGFDFGIGQGWKRLTCFFSYARTSFWHGRTGVNLNYGKTLRLL